MTREQVRRVALRAREALSQKQYLHPPTRYFAEAVLRLADALERTRLELQRRDVPQQPESAGAILERHATEHAREVQRCQAAEFRARVLPLIRGLISTGLSMREIASRLNESGIMPRRAKLWSRHGVQGYVEQLRALPPEEDALIPRREARVSS